MPPGEYGVNMDANGLWSYLNDYATGLDQVNSGDSFPLDKSFRLRVKAGGPLRLFFPTRECDLPHMNPCFATTEVAEDNDGPGDAKVVFPTVADAVGYHVIKGGDPNDPNWEMTYSVAVVTPAHIGSAADAGPPGGPLGQPADRTYPNSGLPGSGMAGSNAAGQAPAAGTAKSSGCVDASTPHSQFRIVGRAGLSLRGSATDTGCLGRSAPVSRVEVAVARRSGGGCSYLDARGRFGAPASCSVPRSFLPARGTRSWRFSRRLRAGSYVVFSRAIDRAGNVEYQALRANRARLRIR